MPKLPIRIAFLKQHLEGGLKHVEPLLFPELSRLSISGSEGVESLLGNIQRLVNSLDPALLHFRRPSSDVMLDEVVISAEPPSGDVAWRRPVDVPVQFAYWDCGDHDAIAYVPALDIDILVRGREELRRQVEYEVRAALVRGRMFQLDRLTPLAQFQSLELAYEAATVSSPTTAKWAEAQDPWSNPQEGSALKQVATDLRKEELPQAYETEATTKRFARLLRSPKNPHVLLIGPSGVGKTAAFYELIRRRKELDLRGREFWETSGARLVAGMSGFGMWQDRCQRLLKETSERNVVLHLGNLVELMGVGQSVDSEQSIASFLRNALYRGELTAVAECTEAQVSVIERQDPQLLAAFQPLRVDEPDSARLQAILLAAAVEPPPAPKGKKSSERRSKKRRKSKKRAELVRSIAADSLIAIEQLHARFATYSSAPGRPLRFLRNLIYTAPYEESIEPDEVTRAFAKETGLPLFLLDAPMMIDATRDWFSQRLIGQADPVDVVIDLLATIKAGLSRPDRPLASLFFIGPTGVGKTELAKSIAAFLYDNERRLVRFDMSEFSNPIAVDRLIGGSLATEGLLTRRIREQPFTVVLFDEVEKADAAFFDLLLQILGEGRLTDSSGRVADFRNSVIIMTSNLGADAYRGSRLGLGDAESQSVDAELFFVRRVREFMRPELFNRLDRIVPFRPLGSQAIQAIAKRELNKLRQRDGAKYRELTIEVSDEAFAQLAADGVESTLGARPLKRVIERTIAAPLADRLNNHTGDHGFSVTVDCQDGLITLDAAVMPMQANRLAVNLHHALSLLSVSRRRTQRLANGSTTLRLRNELFRLDQREEMLRRRLKKQPHNRLAYLSVQEVQRHQRLQSIIQDVEGLEQDASAMEERSFLSFYQDKSPSPDKLNDDANALERRLIRLLTEIHRFDADKATSVTLSIYSESKSRLGQLAAAYEAYAASQKWQTSLFVYRRYRPELDADAPEFNKPQAAGMPQPVLRLLADVEQETDGELEEPDGGSNRKKVIDAYRGAELDALEFDVIGVGLVIKGEAAFSILELERGRHEFGDRGGRDACMVEASAGKLVGYNPPRNVLRRGFLQHAPRRRQYDLEKNQAHDFELKTNLKLPSESLLQAIPVLLEANLTVQLQRLLDD